MSGAVASSWSGGFWQVLEREGETPSEPASGLLNERWSSFAKATADKQATGPEKICYLCAFQVHTQQKGYERTKKGNRK